MAERIRFYLDQHFPHAVTQSLRQRGIDVLTAQEAGRCGLSDADQLTFATSDERVLVSFDADFLALHHSGTHHAGIAWCPQQKYGIGMLIQLLELLHGLVERDQMHDHIEFP